MFMFSSTTPLQPRSTLFPYTTLFRSKIAKQYHNKIDVIYVGPEARPDGREFLKQLAKASGGQIVKIGEHTSELQSPCNLVCRLLLEKKKTAKNRTRYSIQAVTIAAKE